MRQLRSLSQAVPLAGELRVRQAVDIWHCAMDVTTCLGKRNLLGKKGVALWWLYTPCKSTPARRGSLTKETRKEGRAGSFRVPPAFAYYFTKVTVNPLQWLGQT